MRRTLFAWIGQTDLNAAQGRLARGVGPIRSVVEAREYERVVLLSNYGVSESQGFVKWLSDVSDAEIRLVPHDLTSPTNFSEIHEAVVSTVAEVIRAAKGDVEVTFHLSPGTPAMAAVWIILAKTRFPAELVESSLQAGVRTVSLPFDISAEFLPDLLARPDEDLARLVQGLPPAAPGFGAIVHRSAEMKKVIARATNLAVRGVSVLIEGESGTGKELIARAIHASSPRSKGPFVAVNCGAIPPTLVESEFFGHEKGAFTGANAERKGHFEVASGGTLFLDEIGELSLEAQVKLLRVLQESEVTRVGATKPVPIDVRIVAATNRSLRKEVAERRFREDLYYRVAVGLLQLPPVRERRGDFTLLVDALLERINDDAANQPGFQRKRITPAARNLLAGHNWPGNVRELQNVLLRASIWAPGEAIGADEVREALAEGVGVGSEAVLGRPLGDGFDLKELLAQVARNYLRRGLEQAGGNKTKAAELVGLSSYQTLNNWITKYGVS